MTSPTALRLPLTLLALGLALGASRPLPELFTAAGLTFHFGPETMGELMHEVGQTIDRIPA